MMASAKETGNTDEKLEIFCDPCQVESEHIIAVSYCEECNEYLCKHCHKAHRRLAATRAHIVREHDLQEKSLSRPNNTETKEKCIAHEGQVIDHYCISHEELCCPVCLSQNHQQCGKDAKNIADYLEEIDMEKEKRDFESKICRLADNVNGTMNLVKKNLKVIQHTHDVAQANMLKAKIAAFEHIEDIYSSLKKQLCRGKEEDLNKVLPYRNKCQAITFDIKTLESFFKEKKKGDKYSLFLEMKKADIKIISNLDDLNEIKSEKCLNVRRYCFKPDSGITNMTKQPFSFGSFDAIDNARKLANPVATLNVSDMDDEKTCCVTGLAVLSNTRLVLVDNENRSVKLINLVENTIMSCVKYESAPWDMTLIISEKPLIAITVPETETINFLSVIENAFLENLQQKFIKVNGKCYGITNSKSQIFVTVSKCGNESARLVQYDFEGNLLDTVEIDAQNPQYVILNADETTRYISDNTQGAYITELSDQNVQALGSLRDEVTGMAIDKTGTLYYCDSYYHEIDYADIAKNGGKRVRVNLLPNATPHPKCVAYSNLTDTLFVGKNGNEIDVYTVL